MPRLARLPPVPFGWYYVALHSVADRRIVTCHTDLVMILKLLRRTLRERGARLHAGYVAEREVHLALQVGEGPLSAIIGGFQHEYARIFNRNRGEQGSLFRLHHHVLLFQHQRWLVPLVHFIHWIRRLRSPEDHASGLWWSSDAVYRGGTRQDWLTTNVVLRMLTTGTYNRHAQGQAHRRLFDQVPEPGQARLFTEGSAVDSRLLGDAQFIADVWRRIGRRSPEKKQDARHHEDDIAAVVAQLIEQFNSLCDERLPQRRARAWRGVVTYVNVRSRSRQRPLPMVRALSVSYLIEHDIAALTQAARFFGCSPRTVSLRRRRFYTELFRERFGCMPDVLFSSGRDGERNVGRKNEDLQHVRRSHGDQRYLRGRHEDLGRRLERNLEESFEGDFDRTGCSEPPDVCDVR